MMRKPAYTLQESAFREWCSTGTGELKRLIPTAAHSAPRKGGFQEPVGATLEGNTVMKRGNPYGLYSSPAMVVKSVQPLGCARDWAINTSPCTTMHKVPPPPPVVKVA